MTIKNFNIEIESNIIKSKTATYVYFKFLRRLISILYSFLFRQSCQTKNKFGEINLIIIIARVDIPTLAVYKTIIPKFNIKMPNFQTMT